MEHGLGYVPVMKNKGVPRLINGVPFYDSPFSFATDLLDLVLMNGSYLQVSISTCVYPQRVMLGDECDFSEGSEHCFDGRILDPQQGNSKICPKCNGSGLKSRMSPLGTILLKPKGDTATKASDAIYFASPSTETLDFLEEKIDKDENRARNILHLYSTNSNVKGTDTTATESAIDQKSHYSFIKPISDQMFQMYKFILLTIGKMREGDKFVMPTLIESKTFDFLTEQDYLNQLKAANEAELPPYVIYTITWNFLNTLYHTEKQTASVLNIIMDADRLATLKRQDIETGILKGTILPYEKILHESAITFINELITENPNYLELKLPEQIAKLVDKAKAKAVEVEQAMPKQLDISTF
jgi:hypothetical protein